MNLGKYVNFKTIKNSMSRRELYSNLREIGYEISKRKGQLSFEEFLKSQSYFNDNSIESKIAYLILSDQMFFLDRMLVSKIKEFKKQNSNFSCIDVGCGLGINLRMLKDEEAFNPYDFYCLEYDNKKDSFFNQVCNVISNEFKLNQTHIFETDILNVTEVKKIQKSFDFVYVMGLIPMLPDVKKVIANLKHFTKKGGNIFFDFYDPEGYIQLIDGKNISNVELGQIWITCSERFKANFKRYQNGIVEFRVNKFYRWFSGGKRHNFLRNINFVNWLHEIFNKIFWDSVYYWYPSDYIKNILCKEEGLKIIDFVKSKTTPKTAIVLEKLY